MAKVVLRLRQHDGQTAEAYPICYYIRYSGRPYYRRTGYFSEVKHWNLQRQEIRAGHPMGKKLQVWLDSERLQLQQQLNQAEADGLVFKDAVELKEQVPGLIAHFELRVKELYAAGDLGNMNFYQRQLTWLKSYFGPSMSWAQLNYNSLARMIAYCDGLSLSYNTIRQRVQTIKAVYNDALKRYPGAVPAVSFDGLLKGRAAGRTSGRQVQHQTLEDLKLIFSFKPKDVAKQKALNFWRLSFLLQGAGLIDVLYFDPTQIYKGYYNLQRLKMPKKGVMVNMLVSPLAQEIINHYSKPAQPYAFDFVAVARNNKEILPGNQGPEGTRQYNNARNLINKNLRLVSKQMELSRPLSVIQARHSWVITARDLGISKEVIQQCIGHQGQQVIDKHYFGHYEQSQLDAVNLKVLAAVTGGLY
jgi:integrase/recombinase XerD